MTITKSKLQQFTVAFFLIALCLPAYPQTTERAHHPYSEAIVKAREIVQTHMDTLGIPGVTAGVAVGGRIVWSEGFGFADLETRVPVWPHTKMRIGSVSKTLTSAALALLAEQGRLDWDAEVQTYVPTFPQKRYPITVRQVAGHLAGIRHYRDAEFLSSRYYDTILAGLEFFQDDTLLFEPGTKYAYSSYGWNLLSAVVKGASGQEFLSFMQEQVFAPLDMRSTLADVNRSIIHNRTRFYVNEDGVVYNAPYVDNSYKWAGGGYLSTATDLLKFGNAMLANTLLQPETFELLIRSQKTRSGKATGYGIGWSILEAGGQTIVGHSGGSIGGTTVFYIHPDEQIVLAMICNLSGARLRQPGLEILQAFVPKPASPEM